MEPGEERAGEHGELGGQEAEERGAGEGDKVDPEVDAELAGIGFGDAAERGVAMHLGEARDKDGGDEEEETDDDGVKAGLRFERIAGDGEKNEDKDSGDGPDESAHAEENAGDEIEVEEADEVLGETGCGSETGAGLVILFFAELILVAPNGVCFPGPSGIQGNQGGGASGSQACLEGGDSADGIEREVSVGAVGVPPQTNQPRRARHGGSAEPRRFLFVGLGERVKPGGDFVTLGVSGVDGPAEGGIIWMQIFKARKRFELTGNDGEEILDGAAAELPEGGPGVNIHALKSAPKREAVESDEKAAELGPEKKDAEEFAEEKEKGDKESEGVESVVGRALEGTDGMTKSYEGNREDRGKERRREDSRKLPDGVHESKEARTELDGERFEADAIARVTGRDFFLVDDV